MIERISAFACIIMRKYVVEAMPEDQDDWVAADTVLTKEIEGLMKLCNLTTEEVTWLMALYAQLNEVAPDKKEQEATKWIQTRRTLTVPQKKLILPKS